MAKCKNCGADIENDAQICYSCGSLAGQALNDQEKESQLAEANNVKGSEKAKSKKPIVFGVLSLVFSCTVLLGIIFAIIGLKSSKKSESKPGKILSIIGLALSIIVFVVVLIYVGIAILTIFSFFKALSEAGIVFV